MGGHCFKTKIKKAFHRKFDKMPFTLFKKNGPKQQPSLFNFKQVSLDNRHINSCRSFLTLLDLKGDPVSVIK